MRSLRLLYRYTIPTSYKPSDAFDLDAFFTLHDFNLDGMWSVDEIEAIYGVHHPYSKARSENNDAHDSKAKLIVDSVLKNMDKNGDGAISLTEFREVGLDGLPDYSSLGAEGHHYDEESGACRHLCWSRGCH